MTLKCKLCNQTGIKVAGRHLYLEHNEISIKLFHQAYTEVIKPLPIEGEMKKVEGTTGVYEPDDKMYASFESSTDKGMEKMKELAMEYFSYE